MAIIMNFQCIHSYIHWSNMTVTQIEKKALYAISYISSSEFLLAILITAHSKISHHII